MTAAEALAAAGIYLHNHAYRTHRTACPRCDKGPRDDALAVTIHSDADVVWNCHRCHWADGWRAEIELQITSSIPKQRRKSDIIIKTSDRAGRHDLPQYIASLKLRPITAADIAGRYFAGRNCALPQNDVLFSPAHWHPHEQRCFPCIVAIISDIITAEPISLHFTFLDPDGDGKAKIDKPRLYLAGHRKAGGVVRLHADDEVTMGVIIGEGLETCLTAAAEFAPVWACLDAGNLAAFPVLPGIEGVTVLVDNDQAGRDAFEAVRNRYNTAGIEVLEISTSGRPGADLNDVVAA